MNIIKQINHVQQVIHQTEIACHRLRGDVKLLAVSKGQSSVAIEEAFKAGLKHFGENYLQEAHHKMQVLAHLPLCWHFIGPIQSNKTKAIAGNFSWVHSVCREKIAHLLNDARPKDLPPLNVCIQVNLDNEETKSGIQPHEAINLAACILQLPHLRLRGLMAIPKPQADEAAQYASFLRLAQLQQTLNEKLHFTMDTLSMGMSHDFQAAIRAGSTMVRLGTAIFGERKRITDEN